MIPDFAKNGLVMADLHSEGDDLYVVIDVVNGPQYRPMIIEPVNKLLNKEPSKEILTDRLIGVAYQPINLTEQELKLREISKRFSLWYMPFTLKKYKEDTKDPIDPLEVLLTTFEWRSQGRIYVPDEIKFNSVLIFEDLKKVSEFYRI